MTFSNITLSPNGLYPLAKGIAEIAEEKIKQSGLVRGLITKSSWGGWDKRFSVNEKPLFEILF